jgi:hypothetical protein
VNLYLNLLKVINLFNSVLTKLSVDIIKKFYSEGDEIEIIELLNLCFREWKQYKDPLNYWKWKWLDVPNGATIVIVKKDEKIIAVSHRMYPYVKVGDSELMSGYGDDFATHPDYRVKGLFKELQNFTEAEGEKRGCKLIVSVNSNPITIKNNIKRGRLLLPYKIEHMVLIKDVRLHFQKAGIKHSKIFYLIFSILKILNKISSKFSSFNSNVQDIGVVSRSSHFDDRYDVFWNKIKGSYKLINVKDKQFLNWRYADKRGGNYLIYEVADGSELLGYTILEVRDKEGYKSGNIMELLSLPGREDVLITLINALKAEIPGLGINSLNFKTTSKSASKLLESLGLIRMPYTKDFQAMYGFFESDVEKDAFLSARSDEIYFGYGNYF